MRVALIVGLDDYPGSPLQGCVNDASRIHDALSAHYDLLPNFSCQTLLSTQTRVTRGSLREKLHYLFAIDSEVTVFYFAGHGFVNSLGGYLVTQDIENYDEGVSMTDLLTLANESTAREVLIILDCCHSGAFGAVPTLSQDKTLLREGISILCACRSSESSIEIGGSGLFTALACEAMLGGAADLLGDVTVASIYSFVDRNMGPWDQRPLFKANLARLASLRRCDPDIDVTILRLLHNYFDSPESTIVLTTDDDDEDSAAATLAHFRSYRSAGIVKTAPHAFTHGEFGLTTFGKYYWQLVKNHKI